MRITKILTKIGAFRAVKFAWVAGTCSDGADVALS